MELDARQLAYLRAIDGMGLIPNPYDVAHRLARSFGSGASFHEFAPRREYATKEQQHAHNSAVIRRQAVGLGRVGGLK